MRDIYWEQIITAVGAGPRLIVDGRVEVGTEEKIKTLSGTRSAIGFTKNGEILLVSASSATINQLAQIMKDLGAYQAMNLDGGASSALYVNGNYLRSPGRTLNNVLVFSLPEVQVNLIFTVDKSNYLLNSFPFTMDSSPIIKDGRTFLPVRYVAEPLGANISWDNHTKKVTITLEPTVLELWVGKPVARVNGKDTPIDSQNSRVVPIIINGRTLLPLRFISETLGAQVLWNERDRTISVNYPIK
ncbi:MAG: hypothetical protein DDT23_01301 [candidate division WS2 bacterium]|nr:hypothetical protein [Candidatus Lithacetigena glycinireducens]